MKHMVKNKAKMLKRKMFNTALLLIFSVIIISTYYTANFSKAKDIVEVSVKIRNSLLEEDVQNYEVTALEGSDGDSFYVKLPEYINNKKVIKYSYYLGDTDSVKTETQQEPVSEEITDETEQVISPEETTLESEGQVENVTNEGEVEQETNQEVQEESATEELVKQEETLTENEQEDSTGADIIEIGPNDVLPESKIYLTTAEVEHEELTIVAHYDTKQIGEEIYYQQLLTR